MFQNSSGNRRDCLRRLECLLEFSCYCLKLLFDNVLDLMVSSSGALRNLVDSVAFMKLVGTSTLIPLFLRNYFKLMRSIGFEGGGDSITFSYLRRLGLILLSSFYFCLVTVILSIDGFELDWLLKRDLVLC